MDQSSVAGLRDDRNGDGAADRGAPQATVEALMYSLRDGIAALKKPANTRRLSELNGLQMRAVVVRLQKFKPEIARAWTRDEVAVVAAARKKLRHG
jgi:hypothetical protein